MPQSGPSRTPYCELTSLVRQATSYLAQDKVVRHVKQGQASCEVHCDMLGSCGMVLLNCIAAGRLYSMQVSSFPADLRVTQSGLYATPKVPGYKTLVRAHLVISTLLLTGIFSV